MSDLTFYNLEDRRWPNERLKSAAIVGHTTLETARIWVRTESPGRYWLVVSTEPIDTNGTPEIIRGGADPPLLRITSSSGVNDITDQLYEVEETVDRKDRTHVFDVSDLSAGTRYFYALVTPPRLMVATITATPGAAVLSSLWICGESVIITATQIAS